MRLHNKILPVALVAALLGGTVGALVMHNRNTAPGDAQVASANFVPNSAAQQAAPTNDATAAQNNLDPNAYRAGFNDGFATARDGATGDTLRSERVVTRTAPTRVVYRTARSGRRYATSSRTAYYDYAPRQRSFWQKHRDKLTVAMGTGGGALLGGLIGGKKGAAIGALAGGGGSALYTYKIRRRSPRY
ncbi:MAG: hypothetical protein LC746_06225 [Acidobacteria bacterium]|nr:hypothetical protein [Acidobacteriota bacterium]